MTCRAEKESVTGVGDGYQVLKIKKKLKGPCFQGPAPRNGEGEEGREGRAAALRCSVPRHVLRGAAAASSPSLGIARQKRLSLRRREAPPAAPPGFQAGSREVLARSSGLSLPSEATGETTEDRKRGATLPCQPIRALWFCPAATRPRTRRRRTR